MANLGDVPLKVTVNTKPPGPLGYYVWDSGHFEGCKYCKGTGLNKEASQIGGVFIVPPPECISCNGTGVFMCIKIPPFLDTEVPDDKRR